MVLRHGLILVLVGLVTGLAGALAATRMMASMLFGVSPGDPMTCAAVSFILLITALLACYLPARRAATLSPVEALRCE